MKSNYKKLGDYIAPAGELNNGMQVDNLLGISNAKYFQKAKTNTIGINLETYRIVRKGQFAFNRATTRNGDKISIALRYESDCIVSPSYRIFEVVKTDELLPEYLMMWFRRPEFDRYARYKSHGSAHEFFEYNEMCEIELPIPSIEKQKEIIKEYHTITDRIKLNEQLNQKLEDTAQSIYKEWFVNFEFPDDNGKPYKSNGGEMAYCDELDMEIPKGWKKSTLSSIIKFSNGKSKPSDIGTIPIYGGNGILGYTNQNNYSNIIAIGRVGAYCGSLYKVDNDCWISDNAIAATTNDINSYCYYLLKFLNLNSRSEGTGQPLLTQTILNSIEFLLPSDNVIHKFNTFSTYLLNYIKHIEYSNATLEILKETLLSKMATTED